MMEEGPKSKELNVEEFEEKVYKAVVDLRKEIDQDENLNEIIKTRRPSTVIGHEINTYGDKTIVNFFILEGEFVDEMYYGNESAREKRQTHVELIKRWLNKYLEEKFPYDARVL